MAFIQLIICEKYWDITGVISAPKVTGVTGDRAHSVSRITRLLIETSVTLFIVCGIACWRPNRNASVHLCVCLCARAFVCMCVSVCICMWVCAYICVCMWICVCGYVHVCVGVFVCTCMCFYVYVCICACTCICLHVCMCAWVCSCMCVCACLHVCVLVCLFCLCEIYDGISLWNLSGLWAGALLGWRDAEIPSERRHLPLHNLGDLADALEYNGPAKSCHIPLSSFEGARSIKKTVGLCSLWESQTELCSLWTAPIVQMLTDDRT